jgi:phosphate transport system substrate-binding protein
MSLRLKVGAALVLAAAGIYVAFGWGGGSERYLINGSSTVAPILAEAAVRLEEQNSRLKIDVQTGGSTRGILDTRDGRNSAGMASRDLSSDEADGLDIHPIAYDGIAIIVHAENPIEELSSDQVRQLFTKETASWEALGSQEKAVHVINKAEGRATLEVFLEHFGLENRQIQADAVVGDNAQGVRLVAGDPQAIGYVSIGEALAAKDRGVPIKLLAQDGVLPTPASVADGSYPIRRTLNLLFRGRADGIGDEILTFLQSAQGQEIIRGLGFVPVVEIEGALDYEAKSPGPS